MNFGTFDLQQLIYSQLVRGQVDVRMSGGRNKFSKDLAKLIWETFLEDQPVNIDMKTEARARGVSEQNIKMSETVGKAFGFDVMPLTDEACTIYEWIAEQENKGQKIRTFAEWAKKEKAQYIRMYRKDVSNIKIDWGLAFTSTIGREAELI
jgi:hypothetical protein